MKSEEAFEKVQQQIHEYGTTCAPSEVADHLGAEDVVGDWEHLRIALAGEDGLLHYLGLS